MIGRATVLFFLLNPDGVLALGGDLISVHKELEGEPRK
jgi:hypothetical protein